MRFPEFEGVWKQEELDGIASKIQDGTHFSPKLLEEGKYLYITSKNVKNGYIDLTDSSYVSYEDHKNIYKRCDTKKGDVLLTKDGTIGQASINTINEEISLLSSVAFIRSNDKNSNEFICQLLLSPTGQKEIKNSIAGQALKRITLTKIKNFRYYFPTLPEQQKIASFFTAIDQKISQLKRKKNLLEQYKKGVMQKLFSQQIRFKDNKKQEYPKWEQKKFGDIYSFRNTNSFSRENLNYEKGDVKNIHYGDIHTKFNTLFDITKEDLPYINEDLPVYKISAENYCKAGDLVFADASEDLTDVGKSIELVNLNNERVLSGLHTILARPDLSKIAIGFGGYLMKSNDIRKQIMLEAQGSKVSSISATKLSCIQLNIPVQEEQTRITNFLSAIDDKINHTQKQIEKTELWKMSLLQKMFI